MRKFGAWAATLLFLIAGVPGAQAAFGPESPDGFPINVDGKTLYPPVQPLIGLGAADPLNKAGPFTVYPYYPLLTGELQRLALEYPHLVKLTSAGKSTLGLDQWLLEIADFDNPEMIPLEQREVVYVDGGTHSNEYSGVYFVTEIAQFLIEEYETNETARWIVENRHVWILPMINPDGSNAFGRMNAKWVNINRNFPGTYGTVDEDLVFNNPGPAPASEIETQNVIALLDQLQPDYVNSIHCCGNLWLHPYGAEQLGHAPDFEMFTRICDEVFAEVRSDCGEIWSTIYPASGTTADEGYMRNGASSWSYEMSGRGAISLWGQPAIRDDVRIQERESWDGVLHAMLNVHLYGAYPSVLAVEGDAESITVQLQNIGYGPLLAGNVSIGDARAALPMLAVNETVMVTLAGQFAAGHTQVSLDWQDRIYLAPWEQRRVAIELQENSGGGFVGAFEGAVPMSAAPAAAAGQDESVPGPALSMMLGALGVAFVVANRRRK